MSRNSLGGSLDIDGNGEYDALTDGLLLLRGMFGLTGDTLIDNAVATDAIYTSSTDILSRIESVSDDVDIDNNGEVDALSDGLMILRYLFGLRGDVLLNGVVADDGDRDSASAIELYIASLLPAIDDNANSVNTSGAFELIGSTVTLQDYNPASQKIIKTQFDLEIADGLSSADLRSAPLNLANIKNGVASPVGDYSDALLRFDLSSALPVVDGSGTVDLYVTTGADAVRGSSESQIHCQLLIDWSSDGVTASIVEPSQKIKISVIRSSYTAYLEIDAFDIMAVSVDEVSGVKTLDIKLLSALSEGVKVAGGLLDSLLVPRILHIKLITDMLVNDSEGFSVTEFDSVIRLDN
ncbi:hypothetical protein NYF23_05860 [SAR92 clade bacterium H455]|uniref:Dockerin domain-containing protein n=1 Tax=SAR92 clade bacterium H455 TaxID=2974818 RepID=A0ABY5TTX5_9GAMM|nr:hypothetical protein NYF23_05860 [SAR92 clade bacterium H455]